jgi:PAS domain-containing protein
VLVSTLPGAAADIRKITDAGLRDFLVAQLPAWRSPKRPTMPDIQTAGENYVIVLRCRNTGWVAAGVLPEHVVRAVIHEPLAELQWNIILALLILFGLSVLFITRHNILRRRAESAAERRSAMQKLVASMSARILHVEAARIDSAVEQALRELGQCLGVDHIFLYQTTHEGRRQMLAPLSNWHAEGAPETEYSSLVPLERWSWLQDVIARLRPECFSSLADLPAEAATEAADWHKAGIRSFIAAPVKGARMTVLFWFISMRRKADWTAEELQVVRLACGILVSALENKFAEIKIRQSEERFRVALQDSPVAVFSQDAGLRYSWVYNPPVWMNAFSLIGQTDYDIYPPDIAERLTAIKRAVLTNGGVHHEEITVPVKPEQNLTYDVTVEPLYDLEGGGCRRHQCHRGHFLCQACGRGADHPRQQHP